MISALKLQKIQWMFWLALYRLVKLNSPSDQTLYWSDFQLMLMLSTHLHWTPSWKVQVSHRISLVSQGWTDEILVCRGHCHLFNTLNNYKNSWHTLWCHSFTPTPSWVADRLRLKSSTYTHHFVGGAMLIPMKAAHWQVKRVTVLYIIKLFFFKLVIFTHSNIHSKADCMSGTDYNCTTVS